MPDLLNQKYAFKLVTDNFARVRDSEKKPFCPLACHNKRILRLQENMMHRLNAAALNNTA